MYKLPIYNHNKKKIDKLPSCYPCVLFNSEIIRVPKLTPTHERHLNSAFS